MPHNTDHWDSMREYEERIKELREQAEEEGIEISEDSIKSAMSFLSDITPAQGGENPSRLLVHKTDTEAPDTDVDEWKIPNSENPTEG